MTHAKAIAALVGIPFGFLMLAALVLQALEGEWEPDTCSWCEWTMGGAGLLGLFIGMATAGRVWSGGRPQTKETFQRADRLVAGWLWSAIVLALIAGPALVQGRWEWALAAIPIAGTMWFALWWSSRRR